MKAIEDRIFVFGGKEYRLVAGEVVNDFPKDVIDKMLKLGLIRGDEKPARKTGRRKK